MTKKVGFKRVGFIGLGTMGSRMGRCLLKHGIDLTVFDLDPESIKSMVDSGAKKANTPKAVGMNCDVVIAMLPSPEILISTVLGKEGLIHGMKKDSIIVDMATDGMAVIKRLEGALKDKGIKIIDAPVGRGPEEAERGNLFILMGGEQKTCQSLRELMSILGTEVYYCGPLGSGQSMKLVNNMVSSTNMAVIAEAYALARRAGADIELLQNLLLSSAADSWQLRNGLINKALVGDFTPRFKVSLAQKDVALAVEMAKELGAPSDMARAALHWYERCSDAGHKDLDRAAIVLVEEPNLFQG